MRAKFILFHERLPMIMSMHGRALTSTQDFNVDGVWEGSVPNGGEGEDLDGVGLWGYQVLNGSEHTILDVMNLPLVYRPGRIHGVVHTIAFHLQNIAKGKPPSESCGQVCFDWDWILRSSGTGMHYVTFT